MQNSSEYNEYMSVMQGIFGNLHPYFAEGDFPEKYRFAVDAAREGRILDDRLADIQIKSVAEGKKVDEIAREYNITRERIRQLANKGRARLKWFVTNRGEIFDELYLNELEQKVKEGTATPLERFSYERLESAENIATTCAERIAELESELSRLRTGRSEINIYQMRVEDLGIPNHARNRIKGSGILTADQLLSTSETDLLHGIRNFGETDLIYVKTALGYLGLAIKGFEPNPFPAQDKLYQMPTSFILSKRTSAELRHYSIETIGDLSAKKDVAHTLKGATGEETRRAIAFYRL